MATPFQASVTSAITQSTDVTASNSCLSLVLGDDSNYSTNTESGHALANFANYRTFTVTYYQGSVYPLSSVASPPTCTAPSSGTQTASLNITTGDGWYAYTLNTVPTWNSGGIVYVANVNQVYDTVDGNIYTCIANNTSDPSTAPHLTPAKWELVPANDIPTTLFSKYTAIGYFALSCNTAVCLPTLISNALCNSSACDSPTLCTNANFLNAVKAFMLYYSIQNANALNRLQFSTNQWDLLNKICGC